MRRRLRRIVGGTVAVLGGIAVLYVATGGTGGSPPPVATSACSTADASGCVADQDGTFVTWTNPTQGDVNGSFMSNCTGDALAYAQHAADSSHHAQATVTKPNSSGPDWPVHFVVNFTGATTMTTGVGININGGCTGQGLDFNTTMLAASPGASTITVASVGSAPSVITSGVPLMLGSGANEELINVASVSGTSVTLAEALQKTHTAGDRVRALIGIDIVVEIHGDGILNGFGQDAMKVGSYAGCTTNAKTQDPNHDGSGTCDGLNIAGLINAGPRATGAHQDCLQVLGGVNIGLFDITTGDWANKTATCDGAGGALYLNATNGSSNNWGWPDNLAVERYRGIACNKGMNVQIASQGSSPPPNYQFATAFVRHSEFRAGQVASASPAPSGSQCAGSSGAFNSGTNYAAGIQRFATECPLCYAGTSQSAVTDVVADQWIQGSGGFNSSAFPATGFP